MDKNKLFIGIFALVGIFVFLIAAYYATNQPKQVKTIDALKKVAPKDHVTWSPKKKHILVEYGDLQCPACKAFHDSLKEIEKDKNVKDNITLVYRHFPLVNVHQFSMQAALTAEAAGNQGKFFEMVDKLYDTQEDWSKEKDPTETFRKFAEDLKLDMVTYEADIKSDKTRAVILNDEKSGTTYEVNSTPTFFLNGEKLDVATFDEFKNVLVEAAKK
jgi:protein-disulfide isomerase